MLTNRNKSWYNLAEKRNVDKLGKGENVMTKEKIIQKADELRLSCKQFTPPIDVLSICRQRKILVCEMDLSLIEKKLNHSISGMIISKPGNKIITVNEKDTAGRKNFTIAHELGHDELHLEHDSDKAIVSFRSLKSAREKEADVFAASLLMPKDLVRTEYDNAFYPTVSYLASIFQVSNQAMEIRLQELGLEYIG